MLAPLGYDRIPLAPAWIDWNSPIEINPDLAAELGITNWWPGWPVGGNTIYDLAGSKDGVITGGVTWTFADNANPAPALSFPGTTGYVPCGNVSPLVSSSRFSLMFHAYRPATSSDCPVGIQGTTGSSRTSIFCYGDSRIYFLVENGANSFPSYASPAAGAHHYAMAFNGGLSGLSRVAAYLNGNATALSSGGADPAATTSSATDFNIGRGTDGSIRHASAGVRIWDVIVSSLTLSPSQVWFLSQTPFALAWQPSRVSMFLGSDFYLPDIAWDVEAGADDADYVVGVGSENDAGEVVNVGFAGIDFYAGLLRFDTSIPLGATINSASLRLTHGASSTVDYTGDTITYDASDDEAMPTGGDVLLITWTTESETQALGSLTVGQRFSSVDLTAVVQEVVDRGSYTGSILFRIQSDAAGTGGALVVAAVENTDGYSPASLVVQWTVPAAFDPALFLPPSEPLVGDPILEPVPYQ